MNAATKLAAFGAALAVTFAGALGLGTLVGPLDDGDGPPVADHPPDDTGSGHGTDGGHDDGGQ